MAKDFQIGSHYGPYLVHEVIARGGQGVVLRTVHAQHGVQVALKLLLDPSEPARRRFLREIETLRSLKHPRLPRAFDLGEHEGTLFVALELIEGESLKDLVKLRGPLPQARAADIVLDVARTVAHCHAQGVLHRDLKPANVVLQRGTENPYVVDFGIVKVEGKGVSEHSRLSLTGELLGTPAFMAPEQADGEVAAPADVYGLGAILYYLLSGRHPFEGESAVNVLTQLAIAPTPDVRAVRPEVAGNLAEFLLRAMAKDPADRPQTVLGFCGELDQALRAPPTLETSSRGPKGVVPAALALLVVGLGAFWISGAGRGPSPSEEGTPASSGTSQRSPSSGSTRRGPTPQATKPAADDPTWTSALPGPPGSLRWDFSPEPGYEILDSVHVVGPWVIAQSAALDSAQPLSPSQVNVARLNASDGRHVGSAPHADLWSWDPKRDRTLLVTGDELVGVREGEVHWVARALNALTLTSGPDSIYLGSKGSFEALDHQGKELGVAGIQGAVEHPPLLLSLDPKESAPNRLVVTTTESRVFLLDLSGRPLHHLDLNAPSTFSPTLIGQSEAGQAEVLLTSAGGVLTRLKVSSQELQVVSSGSLGEGIHPISAARVARTPGKAPAQIYVATRHEVLRVSPLLDRIEWGVGPRAGSSQAHVRGLEVADLDRDGAEELVATMASRTSKGQVASAQVLLDSHGRCRHSSPLIPGRGKLCSLGGDSLLVQVGQSLQAWGPWTSLPESSEPELTRSGPRLLSPDPGVRFPPGRPQKVPLTLDPALTRHKVSFEPGTPRGARGAGVIGAGLVVAKGVDAGGEPAQSSLLGGGSSLELTFELKLPCPTALLDLKLDVQEDLGPGFVELRIWVKDESLPLTRQLLLGPNHDLFLIGDLPAGRATITLEITARSERKLSFREATLVLPD